MGLDVLVQEPFEYGDAFDDERGWGAKWAATGRPSAEETVAHWEGVFATFRLLEPVVYGPKTLEDSMDDDI